MIRFVTIDDSSALLKIYSQYINTPITFEYVLPTGQEFSQRIENIKKDYPYFICEAKGQITGYAYAHRYQDREAYQRNAELSVYIDEACTSKGLGRKFYQNAFGFTPLGIYHNTGYKCGKWHDVALFEKGIAAYNAEPAPFVLIRQVPDEKLAAILKAHM